MPKARMEWAQYFRNVVHRYKVAIEGWPESIPFANLSSESSSLSQLELLLRKWKMGKTYWRELSSKEVEELCQKRDAQLENGEIEEPSHRTRSDKGKKCMRRSSDARSRKKYKSAETIDEGEEDDEGGDQAVDSTLPPTSAPLPPQPVAALTSTAGPNSGNPAAQATTPANVTAATDANANSLDPAQIGTAANTNPDRNVRPAICTNTTPNANHDVPTATAISTNADIGTTTTASPIRINRQPFFEELEDFLEEFDSTAMSLY